MMQQRPLLEAKRVDRAEAGRIDGGVAESKLALDLVRDRDVTLRILLPQALRHLPHPIELVLQRRCRHHADRSGGLAREVGAELVDEHVAQHPGPRLGERH